MVKAKTVAVIGAGCSGIVAAKFLIEDGFSAILFHQKKTNRRYLVTRWSINRSTSSISSRFYGLF